MVKLCISLHRRYEEFTTSLLTGIRSALSSTNQPYAEDDKEYGKKKRILIRFAIELYQVGVWPTTEAEFFLSLLQSLIGRHKG